MMAMVVSLNSSGEVDGGYALMEVSASLVGCRTIELGMVSTSTGNRKSMPPELFDHLWGWLSSVYRGFQILLRHMS